MQGNIALADEPLSRPWTVSHFEIEHKMIANGIHADIRRFGWEHSCEAHFEAEAYYIDYSLTPRQTQTRLLHSDRRVTAPPGDIVFLPEGCTFDAHCEPSEHRLLCITFEHTQAAHVFENDGRPFDLPPCLNVCSPRVRQAMARLAQEVREPGFGQDIFIESFAMALAVELCRHLHKRHASKDQVRVRMADWRLRRVRDRIQGGLSAPLSIVDLAEECKMSPRHLIRTFKNTVGITLSDYIANARIERAKRELGKEKALIKVVAAHCGFQSAAAFSAAFRKSTGLTPKQFRQEYFRFGDSVADRPQLSDWR